MPLAGMKDVLRSSTMPMAARGAIGPLVVGPRPWYVTALRLFFALLLLASTLGKLLDIRGFAAVVGTYQVFPEAVLMPAALALSLAELALGIWLLWGFRLAAAAFLTALLHLGYLAWLGLAYLRGLPIENCGCFGVFLARPLTAWTFVEDGLLLVAALFLYGGARPGEAASFGASRGERVRAVVGPEGEGGRPTSRRAPVPLAEGPRPGDER